MVCINARYGIAVFGTSRYGTLCVVGDQIIYINSSDLYKKKLDTFGNAVDVYKKKIDPFSDALGMYKKKIMSIRNNSGLYKKKGNVEKIFENTSGVYTKKDEFESGHANYKKKLKDHE